MGVTVDADADVSFGNVVSVVVEVVVVDEAPSVGVIVDGAVCGVTADSVTVVFWGVSEVTVVDVVCGTNTLMTRTRTR